MVKTILILGASGSIGRQTLDVIKKYPTEFSLVGFSVYSNTRSISSIIRKFPSVRYISVKDSKTAKYYSKKYSSIKFIFGKESLKEIITLSNPYMVVNALVGFVGLEPTIYALENNYRVALANKEALVVGGELVNKLLAKGKGKLYPIDSEHSAIWKCLKVDNHNVDKLILTASGGAFRNLSREELKSVTAKDALNHPTWRMGAKITIDCATMINKAFEVIEAYYLFGYKIEQVDILLHDESYIHSMVKYADGTYRAEINKPDMRNPIKFALFEGLSEYKTFASDNYEKFGDFHFHKFDINRYPSVKYAKVVIDNKGTYGAVFNAANEEANLAFLRNEIPFLEIENIVSRFMDNHKNIVHPTLNQIIKVDHDIRVQVQKYIKEEIC